jgi:hypothetical protein
MFASRGFFVNVVHLLWLRPFAIEDAPAIGPECLCAYVFRFGFTPYEPVCIFLEIEVISLLIFWTESFPQDHLTSLLKPPERLKWSSCSFKEGRRSDY